MPLLKGLTVGELIEQLQQFDPKAIVINETGGFGAIPFTSVRAGVVFRYSKESDWHNGCTFSVNEEDAVGSYQKQPAVSIE